MTKSHLRAVFGDFRPFSWEEIDGNGNIVYHGIVVDSFRNITTSLNITTDLTKNTNDWGSRLRNGTYTGMLRMVRNDEVDVAIGPFIQSWEIAVEMRPSTATLVAEMTFVSGYRRLYTTDLAQFPFDSFVSILLIATCLVVASMFYITLRRTQRPMSLWNALYLSQSILLQDPINNSPFTTGSSRFVLAGWSFGTLIFANIIGGGLRSLSAVKTPVHLMNNFQEIVDRPSLRPIVYADVGILDVISEYRSELAGQLKERADRMDGRLRPSELFSSETINSVMDGKAVVIMDKISVLGAFPALCGLYNGMFHINEGDRLDVFGVWYFSPMLDPDIRQEIDRRVNWYMEMGVPWVRDRDMVPKAPKCFTFAQQLDAMGESETFSLDTMWPFILCWMLGCIGSSTTLLMELIIWKIRLYRIVALIRNCLDNQTWTNVM